MGLGGRWVWLVLLLGSVFLAFEARAEDVGPLLVFEASAEGLPQGEIREAVQRELGRPLATGAEPGGDELTVGVDPNQRIVVRYRTRKGSAERYLPMPTEPSDIPLIISLAAGNLARNQATEFAPPPPLAPFPAEGRERKNVKTLDSSAEPERPATAPPRAPDFDRNIFGLHFAQDIAIVGGSNVCDANLGQRSDNYACFYEDTENPFWHTPYPYNDSVDTGPVFATQRLLVSYDRALTSVFGIGGRFGVAFGGGPRAGQAPAGPYADETNLNRIPENTPGTGGTPFFPAHLELRATVWLIPLDRGFVSPYVGASFGAAQVDSKTVVVERDCSKAIEDPSTPGDDWDQAANGDFEDCSQGRSNFDWRELPETRVDAWKKMGQAFTSFNMGAIFRLGRGAGLVVNLNTMYMFPASGIVFEPSIGGVLMH